MERDDKKRNSERFFNGLISGGMCMTNSEAIWVAVVLLVLWVLFG